MKTETKGKALLDFEKIIKDVHDAAFDDGEKTGRKNEADEMEQGMELEFERRNTEYVVSEFADCHTLADFQDKLKWIALRSYNFL